MKLYLICVECRYELEVAHVHAQGCCPNCSADISAEKSILKITFSTLGESWSKKDRSDKFFFNPCPEYTQI